MPVWLIPVAYMGASMLLVGVLPRLERAHVPHIELGISASSASQRCRPSPRA